MNIIPAQINFSAGEISPLMHERRDTEGFVSSVEIMHNCIAQSHGPAKNRDPWCYADTFAGYTHGRGAKIQLSADQFLIAVFTDLYVWFYMGDGSPAWRGTIPSKNPNFAHKDHLWDVVTNHSRSGVKFGHYYCELRPHDSEDAYAAIRQEITLLDSGAIHDFSIYSDVERNKDVIHVKVGTSAGASDLVDDSVYVDDSVISFDPDGNSTIYIEIRNNGTDPGQEWNSAVPSGNVVRLTTVGLTESGTINYDDSPYTHDDLDGLQFIPDNSSKMYVVSPSYIPHFFNHVPEAGPSLAGASFTSQPPEWVGGGGSVEDNFPSTGVVHKARLYLAGALDADGNSAIWASKVGSLQDFTAGVTEEDGFSVSSDYPGAILWMMSAGKLIYGTIDAEYLITSDGPVIFVGDISIDKQSTYGSANTRAHHLGDEILYITRGRDRLHAMQYTQENEVWASNEISYPSEHILKAGAKKLSWEQYPNNLVWMPLEDGTLASCSYNRPMGVYGWHQHSTQGDVVDLIAGHLGTESRLALLAVRSSGDLVLEISKSYGVPVDSKISRHFDVATTVVDNLGIFEGEVVQVVTNGAVHPDLTVTGGEIQLQEEAEFVELGLGFQKRVKTLPLDRGALKGSGRTHVKRYKDIFVGLLESAIPYINGTLPNVRTPSDAMNTIVPFVTGLVKVNGLGFSKEAPIDIIQPGPLPLHVTGVWGEVTQDKP